MSRYLKEDLGSEVGPVLGLTEAYALAVRDLYRQLSLQSSELLRGSAITKLELAFNSLKKEHYRLLNSHLTSDIFNVLEENSVVKPVKVLNFTAIESKSSLSKQSTYFFDKFELPQSSEKSIMEEFETHTGFLGKLDYFEKVNIGHIYCVEDIRKKSRIISGKFGTAICNDYDQIISKIKHHADKIYNCRFWKSYQLYFPSDEQVFIWKDDGVTMYVNHVFNGGRPQEMLNYSKCVQSIENKVYFLAVPSQIIELDWDLIEHERSLGVHYFTGRLVFELKGITDFVVYKNHLFYITSSERVGKTLVKTDHPNLQQAALIDPNHLSYLAITANKAKVIVAGHHDAITKNIIFVLNHDLVTEYKVGASKLDKGYNPIRSLQLIERVNSTYLLCVFSADLIVLFSLTATGLNRLEQVTLSAEEDRAHINGVHIDSTQSKIFVFGDFNFQQMLKLRI